MEFKVRAEYWKKGAKSYGDRSVIHHSPSAALRFGLEGIIAPGMWLASNIQGRMTNVSSIKQIKFSGNVYDGDVLNVEVTPWKLGKGRDYIFTRDGEKILQMRNVKAGELSKAPDVMGGEIVHTYGFVPSQKEQKRFVNSLGIRYDGNFPNTYILATSASSLLSLSEERGFIGVHASQTFDVHGKFDDSPVEVLIGNEKVKNKKGVSFHYFDQQWVQDGVVKASGSALAVPIDPSIVQAPNRLRDFMVDVAYRVGADKFYDVKGLYSKGESDSEAA